MIAKRIKVSRNFGTDTFTTEDLEIDIDGQCSGYGCQQYFNEALKDTLEEGHTIVIRWYNNKIYEFRRRKTDDDQRHKKGRKTRAPKHQQTT